MKCQEIIGVKLESFDYNFQGIKGEVLECDFQGLSKCFEFFVGLDGFFCVALAVEYIGQQA